MFIDTVKIRVQAGDGGNGCVSFRREKYIPRGGPDGGGGGDGGSVILKVEPSVSTLIDLKYNPLQRAQRGEHGQGKNLQGRRGQDAIVPVPPGTIVYDDEAGEFLADLVREGEEFVVARGGQGGKGNKSLANFHNRLPRFCELGEPGERRSLRLELKIIADIAIVGLPNSGKSTLLSKITEAHPRIANYPFTTLSPNLGVVDTGGYRRFVVADIPGLIEGAHQGVGLGHDFLRHIERTKVLVFLLDAAESDPVKDYKTLNNELVLHNPSLAEKPQMIVGNKLDIEGARKKWNAAKRKLANYGAPVAAVSALTGEGLDEIVALMTEAVERVRQRAPEVAPLIETHRRYSYQPELEVRKRGKFFLVSGEKPERWASMTNFENLEAVAYLRHKLSRLNLDVALKREGAGGVVVLKIKDYEVEYEIG